MTPQAPKGPTNLAGLTREGIKAALIAGEACAPDKAKMRTAQIWRWINHFGVTDFDRMTDVGTDVRAVSVWAASVQGTAGVAAAQTALDTLAKDMPWDAALLVAAMRAPPRASKLLDRARTQDEIRRVVHATP